MVSREAGLQQAGTIWVVNLDKPLPSINPLLPAKFRQALPKDLPALAKAMVTSTLADVSKRLESGRCCYTAWVDSQLTAYGWASFEEEYIGEMDLRLRLLPGEAYLWDCFTLPAFRQKRLFSALLVYMLQELRDKPVCRVWIGANQENEASQRGIARAGFHSVADLVVQWGPARRRVSVRSYPGVPESLVSEARRAFLGDLQGVDLASGPPAGFTQA